MDREFERQRKEAEERVREMNRNYRIKSGITPAQEQKTANVKENDYSLQKKGLSSSGRPFDILKMLRLDGIKGDPDRLLLLGIFLLLSGEDTDELLLYALLYIML